MQVELARGLRNIYATATRRAAAYRMTAQVSLDDEGLRVVVLGADDLRQEHLVEWNAVDQAIDLVEEIAATVEVCAKGILIMRQCHL